MSILKNIYISNSTQTYWFSKSVLQTNTASLIHVWIYLHIANVFLCKHFRLVYFQTINRFKLCSLFYSWILRPLLLWQFSIFTAAVLCFVLFFYLTWTLCFIPIIWQNKKIKIITFSTLLHIIYYNYKEKKDYLYSLQRFIFNNHTLHKKCSPNLDLAGLPNSGPSMPTANNFINTLSFHNISQVLSFFKRRQMLCFLCSPVPSLFNASGAE